MEKFFYNLVKNRPWLKNILRNTYQFFNVLIYRPKKIEVNKEYTVLKNSFFGFHDKTPFSTDNKFLLSHKIKENHKHVKLNKDSKIDVGYYSGKNFEKFNKVGETLSWNFQQGSMLAWIDDHKLIYNDYCKIRNKNISRIFNIKTKVETINEFPIGIISNDGKLATSYSFERLRKLMPGYGYENGNDIDYDNDIPLKGLSVYDISSGELIKEIFVQDLPTKNIRGKHFFTHTRFSPSDNKLLFFHRVFIKGERLRTFMYSYDFKKDKLYKFPTLDMVSHVSWKNNNEVIAFAETLEGDGTYIFNISKDNYTKIYINNSKDGHPFVSNDEKIMLFDSYPDRKRLQTLFCLDFSDNEVTTIASMYSPFKFKDKFRCDFHPRLSRDSKLISIDSGLNGIRNQIIIKEWR